MESNYSERRVIAPVITIGEPLGAGSGTITAAGFEAAEAHELVDTIVERYLVAVSETAPCGCIDGRNCIHSKASETEKPEVGPSLAGGALVTAYAAAELVPGYFLDNDPRTFEGRIAAVCDTLVNSPVEKIVIGAHTADSAQPGSTGCGASDKFVTIMGKPSEDKDVVDGVTALLLGEQVPNTGSMDFTPRETLLARIAAYDSNKIVGTDVVDGIIPAENIEILTGAHAELLVVFNYNQGTTVDRDVLVEETGKQVFVVDMWYIDKLARAMSAGRPDAVAMKDKLRHAMVAFQVSTYLTLCDGTHRPVLLQSELAA